MALLPDAAGRRSHGRFRTLLFGSLPALTFCVLLDFVAGGFLGTFFEKIMNSYPLILIILPGLMGLRGNIFGSMASRLTTMLHLGEMEVSLKDERITKNVLLSMLLSLIPVLVLWFIGLIRVGNVLVAVPVLLIVLVSTIFTTFVLGYSTALATVIPYRRGVDPDTVAAPLVTSAADLITVPFLILFLLLYERIPPVFYLSTLFAFGLFLLIALRAKMGERDRKIFREVLGILAALSAVSSISGNMLEHYSEIIYASIIFSVLYPPIADSTGNYGSIIGAKTSTRIHLGEIEGIMDRETIFDILMYFFTAFPIALLMNLIAIFVVRITLKKSVSLLFSFIFYYPFLILLNMIIAYYLARGFMKLGFDPDNVTVPAITTIADLTSVLFIVLLASRIV